MQQGQLAGLLGFRIAAVQEAGELADAAQIPSLPKQSGQLQGQPRQLGRAWCRLAQAAPAGQCTLALAGADQRRQQVQLYRRMAQQRLLIGRTVIGKALEQEQALRAVGQGKQLLQ